MSFPKIKITDKGTELLTRVLSGERIQFTHFAVGSGECGDPDDWKGLTNLIKPEMNVEFSKFDREGNVVNLGGEFSNSSVSAPFWWRELAIFATLPDVPDYGNVMCFYGNAEKLAEYVPGSDASVSVTHKWETSLMISGDADVSAVVHSVAYVTTEQLKKHVDDHNNPHQVSAEQIGLGKVPNVETNDQTPTYENSAQLAELSSGEKLSTAFGKIATAVKNLISHLANKNNPHNVSADQILAAPKNHRSDGTGYGMANESYFGHTKITDSSNSELGANDGVSASPKFVKGLLGRLNYAGSDAVAGAANSAVKLSTERKFKVNLESSADANFDGTQNATLGVSGVLPILNGGIGSSDGSTGLKNLLAAGYLQLSSKQVVEALPNPSGLPEGTCMLLLVQEMN